MKTFVRVNNILGNLAIWISAALLVYIVCHISLEIVMRSFFSASTFSMDEFVGYAIGSMTFLSLAHTFRHRKHIRVSILQSFIRGRTEFAVELAVHELVVRSFWGDRPVSSPHLRAGLVQGSPPRSRKVQDRGGNASSF